MSHPFGCLVADGGERHYSDYHFVDVNLTPSQQQQVDEKYYFNEDFAQAGVDYFNSHILHTKDAFAGVPFILQPWEEAIIRWVFGWRERATGKRRFKTLYLEVPRKNGKTDLAAGFLICLMMLEGVQEAEAYAIATNKDQAKIVFKRVKKMIVQELRADMHDAYPDHKYYELRESFEVLAPSVYMRETGGVFQPLSAIPTGKHGLHTTYVISDEVHEWTDTDLHTYVTDGMAATFDPFEMKTTTAGQLPGVGWDEHNYALKVLKGIYFNPRYLAVIFAANDNDDPRHPEYENPGDPATWAKANPNFGISVDQDFLSEKWQKAQGSPKARKNFLRYYLNVWKEGGGDWIDMGRWKECVPDPENEYAWYELQTKLKGRECYGGLDLSSTTDLTAFALYFPPLEGEKKGYLLVWFFVPKENIDARARTDRVPYDQWVEMGLIEATPGEVVDYEKVRERVEWADQQYDLHGVAYDPRNAEETRQKLEEKGIEMFRFNQSLSQYAGPTREFERLVKGRLVDHGNNVVLSWCVANMQPEEGKFGDKMPHKGKSTERIDGGIASIMAIALKMAPDDEETEDDGTYLEDGEMRHAG